MTKPRKINMQQNMKLYVGNIPLSFTEEDLNSLFKEFDVKSVKLILDRETNKSRGFGFVEFNTKNDGLKAIKDLNGKDCDGRALIVNEARPQREKRSFSSFRSKY